MSRKPPVICYGNIMFLKGLTNALTRIKEYSANLKNKEISERAEHLIKTIEKYGMVAEEHEISACRLFEKEAADMISLLLLVWEVDCEVHEEIIADYKKDIDEYLAVVNDSIKIVKESQSNVNDSILTIKNLESQLIRYESLCNCYKDACERYEYICRILFDQYIKTRENNYEQKRTETI